MRRMRCLPTGRVFVLLWACCLSACAVQARLYDTESGAMLIATFKTNGTTGRGPIWLGGKGDRATSPCKGEYVTVPKGATGWGAIYSGSGVGTATVSVVGDDQPGRAVMSCQDGTFYECEYVGSGMTGHGTGACQDNRGRRYRLMF